jgi:regulatory protein
MTKKDALAKLMRYCAYQERCHSEVRAKLLELGVYGDNLEEVISDLIQQNFLNEERYAKAFVGGKFRIKKWGKNKIRDMLVQKHVSPYCIEIGMKEINEEDYARVLKELLDKKWEQVKERDVFVKRKKVAESIIRRGFEPKEVWEIVLKMD